MSFTRSDIRKFLCETAYHKQLNENTVSAGGLNIGFDDKGIMFGDKKFSLTAITFLGEYPVTIKSIKPEGDGLLIAGSTSVKDVEKPLESDKIAEIKKEVESDKSEFVISGKLADIKFTKIG
jgi:hypothetical protein